MASLSSYKEPFAREKLQIVGVPGTECSNSNGAPNYRISFFLKGGVAIELTFTSKFAAI
jgi:hypothetical protein